ncbi:helix-turn-helix domain-containing protein [Streptomyces sp. NPDC002853]
MLSQTQIQAAEQLDWSLSKLNRIEKGSFGVSVTDLRALLQQYGVDDPDQMASLEEAARGSKGRSWWSPYSDAVSPGFAEYLSYEGAATSLSAYHPVVIPGLLQTDDYAEALQAPDASAARGRMLVELLMERQGRVFDDGGIGQIQFVIDEAALRRRIGGTEVMRQQLDHLKDMAGHPRVGLRVLPFSAGAHYATQTPFILLGFEGDDDLVYSESFSGGPIAANDSIEVLSRFRECAAQLQEMAYDGDRTAELIDEMAGDFDKP